MPFLDLKEQYQYHRLWDAKLTLLITLKFCADYFLFHFLCIFLHKKLCFLIFFYFYKIFLFGEIKPDL